jgi:hypothetical protein
MRRGGRFERHFTHDIREDVKTPDFEWFHFEECRLPLRPATTLQGQCLGL